MNELLFRVLLLMITMLSPAIRQTLQEAVTKLEADVKETVNPWDDLFVAVLKQLIGTP